MTKKTFACEFHLSCISRYYTTISHDVEKYAPFHLRKTVNTWSYSSTFDSYIIPAMKKFPWHVRRPQCVKQVSPIINKQQKGKLLYSTEFKK